MPLFRIEIKAYKRFYVEAESHEEACGLNCVYDEASGMFSGKLDWDHDDTTAYEVEDDGEIRRFKEGKSHYKLLKD